jgi:hypothetical protein
MRAQQSSLIQQFMPPPSPTTQDSFRLEGSDILAHAHLIEPTIVQDEVLEEGDTEQMTETLIDLLSRLKRDIKQTKK